MQDLGILILGAAACAALMGGYKYIEWRFKLARDRAEREYSDLKKERDFWDNTQTITAVMVNAQSGVDALTAAVTSLTEATKAMGPDLVKIGDNAFLMARGAREISDGVTALRNVVFGNKRAEDFPSTIHEAEQTRRSEMAYDIQNLMIDHGLSQQEAERRVGDMYASRRMG